MNIIRFNLNFYATITILHVGTQRQVQFQFSGCFSEAETIIKLGYFAATPQCPQLAFQFQLLDLRCEVLRSHA